MSPSLLRIFRRVDPQRMRLPGWRGFIWMLLLVLGLPGAPIEAQGNALRSPRLGITFISSIDHPASELRYERALLLGAGWNRWPLYWDRVERSPGVFDWTGYDRLVADDARHGLGVDAILLGRPAFHALGGGIGGLTNPAFADGTDTQAPGKPANPANPWATFVQGAVSRYRPGGLLATQGRWPAGAGVTVWEVWNEPDLPQFWSGSVEEYARLLKVAYLVIKAADPAARVMFGGLAYGNPDQDDWLARVLTLIAGDPARIANAWFMDIVGVHNYSYARRSGLVVRRVKETLARFGLDRPVWLNESGVPVWDDYPGPTWARSDPASRALRATLAQQAAFVVESTVYAWAAGAEVVFVHQLYDDCGNQPGGTTFPPHNGELCQTLAICAGDAYGLYRNERTEGCYNQHPLPGSPRPAAGAYFRLAQLLGQGPLANPAVESIEGSTIVSFDRPNTNERVLIVWNRRLDASEITIPALGSEAQVYSMDNREWTLEPLEGQYRIGLAPATTDDYPYLPAGEVSAIGGPPLLLVETRPNPLAGDTPSPLTITPGAVTATRPPRPTTSPSEDRQPPVTAMTPLPVVSPSTFTVSWSAEDDSGIQKYLVWVRIDRGDWRPWLETTATQSDYSGEPGRLYEFAVWAEDLGGNWSPNVDLAPQAVTTVQ